MRILRFRKNPESPPRWGWLAGERIGLIDGSPFSEFNRGEATLPLESVQLLPPVEPSKIICVGRNYVAHAAEFDSEVPDLPLLFLKPPSAIVGHGERIVLPPQSENVQHEAELAIVMGQRGRWISPGEITQHILGYTVANDVTARDLQFADGQWTRGKGFDTFLPLGPWIETELDPSDLMITCTVNGKLRQMASTRDMVFPVNQLVGFVSSIMTLEPGDVILTGTPSGVGPLVDGDEVSVEIEAVGTLTNPVRASARAE